MAAAFRRLACRTSAVIGKLRRMMGTVTGLAFTYGVYKTLMGNQLSYMRAHSETPPNIQKPPFDTEQPGFKSSIPRGQSLPPAAKSQPSVTSHDKAYALFLRVRIKYGVDMQKVASSVARLQEYVQEVEGRSISVCGNFHIFAGVGFGPEFYQQLKGGAPQPFTNSKHNVLSGDGAGGDILIHAKSNTLWMLERLSHLVLKSIPENSMQSHEETYGQYKDAQVVARRQSPKETLGILNYQYSKGELELLPSSTPYKPAKPNLMFVQESGCQDTEVKRREAAVDPLTGGSYVMTQRWVHDISIVDSQGKVVLNDWVDKAWTECASTGFEGEKRYKPPTELGAELATQYTEKWMSEAYRDCLGMQKKKPNKQIVCSPGSVAPPSVMRIVRQSVPYHKPGGEFGLFLISYCRAPRPHELLLDRLIASTRTEDRLNGACSLVFKTSHNVHSAVWYFPGLDELAGLQ